jgi:hypothetical protein
MLLHPHGGLAGDTGVHGERRTDGQHRHLQGLQVLEHPHLLAGTPQADEKDGGTARRDTVDQSAVLLDADLPELGRLDAGDFEARKSAQQTGAQLVQNDSPAAEQEDRQAVLRRRRARFQHQPRPAHALGEAGPV